MHYDFTVRNSCSNKIEFSWEDNAYDGGIGPKYTKQASVRPGRLLRRSVDCVSVGGARMMWCADFSDGELRRQDVYCPEYIAGAAAPRPAAGEESKLDRAKRLLIQKALAALGFDPGTLDGVFGSRTISAIQAWQGSKGYSPTGRLTSVQAESLLRSAPATQPFGPNWIIATNQPCQLHNPFPEPGETVTWSGGCVDGKASGHGRMVWRGSYGEEVYVGSMRDGRPHGRGVETYPDGSRYEGEFRDGRPHGRGVETYPDGSRYEGEFRADRRHGRGTYTYPDGSRYEGEWRDNNKHGRGFETHANGNRYEGEFRDDMRHGRGIATYADGNRYEGEFRDGKPHGRGTATLPDGSTLTCEWRDNRCERAL